MRIAVVGGTGLVGRYVVDALKKSGHEPVVIARSTGVDVVSGDGLAEALAGVGAVVDVTNTAATDAAAAKEFFAAETGHLLAAEQEAGVRHHVVLSIVGIEMIPGNAHYAGKRRQEDLVEAGSVPFTILRATHFHEFAMTAVEYGREGDTAKIPPLLVQPVAARDVGRVLAEVAAGQPQGRIDLAGPEPEDLVDMARRTLAVRGEKVKLVPSWEGPLTAEMAGDVLLPGPGARKAKTTFDAWLKSNDAKKAT